MENPKTIHLHCPLCANHIPFEGTRDENPSCERCGYHPTRLKGKSASKTLAFAITALIFYVPANVLPFMTMELYGTRNSATIWGGVVALSDSGSWFIAMVVFVASVIIPALKLLALFFLSWTSRFQKHSFAKTQIYLAVEYIGRWSMLDIYLLAVLVAIMKLGPWTYVQPEIGSWMFALVVIFTMLASASFDPRLLWKEQNANS